MPRLPAWGLRVLGARWGRGHPTGSRLVPGATSCALPTGAIESRATDKGPPTAPALRSIQMSDRSPSTLFQSAYGPASAVGIVILALLLSSWLMGLDQGSWLVIGLGVGCLVFRTALRWRFTHVALCLLVVMAITGALGASGLRWLTLLRELLIAAALLSTAIGVATLSGKRWVMTTLVAPILGFVVLSSALSVFAVLGGSRLAFVTPIAPFVPTEIAQTDLGRISFLSRSLGNDSFFLGASFLRPNGLFLFSTSQAIAQAVSIPIIVAFALSQRTAPLRGLGLAAVAVVVGGLGLTTTRMAVTSLLFAGAICVAPGVLASLRSQFARVGRAGRRTIIWTGASLVALVVIATAIHREALVDLATTRSADLRFELYAQTVRAWADRPLLGWGVEHEWYSDAAPLDRSLPPLGSHSQYLGLLYKHGLLGLTAFVAVLWVVLAHALNGARDGTMASRAVLASVIVTLVTGMTEELWLDPGTAVVIGVAWGLGLRAGRAASSRLGRSSGNQVGLPELPDEGSG